MSDELFTGLNDRKKKQKESKRLKNRAIFDLKGSEYDFKILAEWNGTVRFSHLDDEYYFYELTGKVRMKGEKETYHIKTF